MMKKLVILICGIFIALQDHIGIYYISSTVSSRRLRDNILERVYLGVIERGLKEGILPGPSARVTVKFEAPGFEGVFDSLDGESIKLELYTLGEILKQISSNPSLVLPLIPAFLKFPQGLREELLAAAIPVLEHLKEKTGELFLREEGFLIAVEKRFVGVEALKSLIEIDSLLGHSEKLRSHVSELLDIARGNNETHYEVRASALKALSEVLPHMDEASKVRVLEGILDMKPEVDKVAENMLFDSPAACGTEEFAFLKAYFDFLGLAGRFIHNKELINQIIETINNHSPEINRNSGKAAETVLALTSLLSLGNWLEDENLTARTALAFQELLNSSEVPVGIRIFTGLLLLKKVAEDGRIASLIDINQVLDILLTFEAGETFSQLAFGMISGLFSRHPVLFLNL
jgi:hypothetical protein